MIQVVFKNLEKSEFVRDAAIEKIERVMDRFPDLAKSRILVTLSMENSRVQAGPDVFTAKVFCQGGRYREVSIQKSAPNLYVALADVSERMLELLNRYGDRKRVKARSMARRIAGRDIPRAANE